MSANPDKGQTFHGQLEADSAKNAPQADSEVDGIRQYLNLRVSDQKIFLD